MNPYITVLVSLSCAALSGAMAFLGFEYMHEGVGLTPAIAFPMATALLYVPFWFVSGTDEAEEDSVLQVPVCKKCGVRIPSDYANPKHTLQGHCLDCWNADDSIPSVFDLYTEEEMGYRPATEEELRKINTGKNHELI